MNGEQIAKYIANYLKVRSNMDVPPEEIWSYTQGGEIYHLFRLYDEAREYFHQRLRAAVGAYRLVVSKGTEIDQDELSRAYTEMITALEADFIP